MRLAQLIEEAEKLDVAGQAAHGFGNAIYHLMEPRVRLALMKDSESRAELYTDYRELSVWIRDLRQEAEKRDMSEPKTFDPCPVCHDEQEIDGLFGKAPWWWCQGSEPDDDEQRYAYEVGSTD